MLRRSGVVTLWEEEGLAVSRLTLIRYWAKLMLAVDPVMVT